MRRIACVLTALIILGSWSLAQERYFTFEIQSRDQVSQISRMVNIDRVEGNRVWAYGSDEGLNGLRKLGLDPEILTHPGINPEATMSSGRQSLTYPLNVFPTYADYVAEMQAFAAAYPAICQLHELGDTTNTVRPHKLWALKITDNPAVEEDEPEVLYTSTMHGDETTGYIMMLDLINELLTHYNPGSVDPYEQEITAMIQSLEIWINPLANPDGTYYSGDTTVSGAIRGFTDPDGSSSGVDPNRNFPDPQDGPHPDGNPYWQETLAMMDFADAHNFILSANFHGGIELANYPWDTWARLHIDDLWLINICRLYADTAQLASPAGYFDDENNGITNGYAWYEANGGRQDYMTFWQGSREVTMEISNTKNPSASSLPNFWDWNRQSMLDYLKQSLEGVRGLVTDPSGNPLAATIEVLGHDTAVDNSYVYTDPDVGDYHRMLLTGDHTLRYSAYGFITQDVTDVSVTTDADATRVDVVLQPAATVTVTGIVSSSLSKGPIADATVALLDTPLDPVTTDGSGHYERSGVLEGIYTFRVTADGYFPVESERTVTTSQTVQDFQLLPIEEVFFTDLESDDGGLVGDLGWHWGVPGGSSPDAYSGTHVWATNLDGQYGNNADLALDLEMVTLPDQNPQLTFWHWHEFENTYDGGRLEISVDSGNTFSPIVPQGGYDGPIDALNDEPGFGGSTSGWESVAFDLDAYAGQTVTLRWHFASDGSQTRLGWYLDDIRILGAGDTPETLFSDGFESGDMSAWSSHHSSRQ